SQRLTILRPQTCTLLLRILGSGELPRALEVALGRSKIPAPLELKTIPAGVPVPKAGLPISISGPDCGSLWATVRWEGGEEACTEALQAEVMPDRSAEVRCTLRP